MGNDLLRAFRTSETEEGMGPDLDCKDMKKKEVALRLLPVCLKV
jgi:hypothetical protein